MSDILSSSTPELTLRFRPSVEGQQIGPYLEQGAVGGDTWGPIITHITVEVSVVLTSDFEESWPDTIYVRFGLRGYETNKDGSRSKRKDYIDVIYADYRNVREYREVIQEAQQKALDTFLTAFPAYRDYPVEGLVK